MWNQQRSFLNTLDQNPLVSSEFSHSPEEHLSPEQRLLLAIIEQAIRDLLENGTPSSKQAHRWFFDNFSDDTCLPFSFIWICKHLDLDMNVVRTKIRDLINSGVPPEMSWIFRR
ncbi:MAG: hypothetical protein GYA55_04940 [SAR324 cluster bacterium]|uniref:Uncharacterized protein n=1 Tax=SAR324 cluster bacterium TaxID=2024889 RepID=A0A7X9FQK8_9DELT|nr:hypothetical protein [SAR324 cluster bacterium]